MVNSGSVVDGVMDGVSLGTSITEPKKKIERMKIFKIDLLNIFFKFLITSLLLTAILILWSNTYNFATYIMLILLIVGVEFLFFFLTRTLVKIEIAEKNVRLYLRNFLVFLDVKTINLDDFHYSFKDEIGARGVKSEELRFYENYKKIIGIGRGFDGWTQKKLFQILNDFEELEIKKID